jgi:hypothetical protein
MAAFGLACALAERLLWAVLVDQTKLAWSNRGDAANGRSELKVPNTGRF